MNIGNILKVADAIEHASVPDVGFNMMGWVTEADEDTPDRSGKNCGTVACVAGWATIIAVGKENVSQPWVVGAAFLGLDTEAANNLFVPNYDTDSPRHAMTHATAIDAVRVLRILAITGKVDWEAAMKGDEPVLPPLPASRALVKV